MSINHRTKICIFIVCIIKTCMLTLSKIFNCTSVEYSEASLAALHKASLTILSTELVLGIISKSKLLYLRFSNSKLVTCWSNHLDHEHGSGSTLVSTKLRWVNITFDLNRVGGSLIWPQPIVIVLQFGTGFSGFATVIAYLWTWFA